MKIETLTCADGSSTLYLPEMDETYHSRKGAVTESEYVYITQGVSEIDKENISILEFGFGTGLNALLSFRYASLHGKKLDYLTIEKFPLDEEILQQINYAGYLEMDEAWNHMQSLPWQSAQDWGDCHTLTKWKGDFLEAPIPANTFDIVFYDAFAPSKQSEVWSIEYLQKVWDALRMDGILVTYCAQGQFKRNLKSLGFEVETLPGPPGKMEMVRAKKK